MDLEDSAGNVVYTWNSGVKYGSGVTWWFTATGDDLLDLSVKSPFPLPPQSHHFLLPAGGDAYCVKIADNIGITGGPSCTPD